MKSVFNQKYRKSLKKHLQIFKNCGTITHVANISIKSTAFFIKSFLSKFRNLKMYTVRIIKRYFAFGEYIRTLRLTSELVDLRVGYAKRIQELRS